MQETRKTLIVNADDFGLTEGVSEGILFAHQHGVVTSTTVMMNRPFARKALDNINLFPDLEVGVHLVCSKDSPLLPTEQVSSLIDENGYFFKNIYSVKNEINLNHLYREFCQQVDMFIEYTGRKPGHLDCHQWFILYPPFFKVYVKVAKTYNLPIRAPFLNIKNTPNHFLQKLLGYLPLKDAILYLPELRESLLESNISHPNHFKAEFYDSQVDINYLVNLIRNLSPGTTELMTHPGFIDEELKTTSSYQEGRIRELEILCDPIIRDTLQENNVELLTFDSLSYTAVN